MRTTLRLLFLFVTTLPTLANPPEEDILRPRIPTRGRFFVGLDAGVNTTWFDGNPIYRAFFPSEEESRMYRSAFGFEPFGSFSFGVNVTPSIRVRLRADYDVRRVSRSGTTVDTCPVLDAFSGEVIGRHATLVDKEFELEIAYATIALIGEYALGDLFVFAGPTWSYPLQRRFTETNTIDDDESVCIYFPGTSDTTRQIRATLEGTDNVAKIFGLKLGVGYYIPMAEDLNLVPQIGMEFPFGSALVDDEEYAFRGARGEAGPSNTTRVNRHMYFRVLQASIGLRYSF